MLVCCYATFNILQWVGRQVGTFLLTYACFKNEKLMQGMKTKFLSNLLKTFFVFESDMLLQTNNFYGLTLNFIQKTMNLSLKYSNVAEYNSLYRSEQQIYLKFYLFRAGLI